MKSPKWIRIVPAMVALALGGAIALASGAAAGEARLAPLTAPEGRQDDRQVLAQQGQQELQGIEERGREMERAAAAMKEAEKAAQRAIEKAVAARKVFEQAMQREMEKTEAARKELENAVAQRERLNRDAQQEAQRIEAARRELAAAAAAQQEAEKAAAAKRELERTQAARRAAESAESERQAAEQASAAKREFDRAEVARRQAEIAAAARRASEQAAAAKRESDRTEAARREAQAAARQEMEKLAAAARQAGSIGMLQKDIEAIAIVPSDQETWYLRGLELERVGKLRAAMEMYKAAAENNNRFAQKKLGDIYGTGNAEIERDYQTSLKWYRRAQTDGLEILNRPFTYPGVRR